MVELLFIEPVFKDMIWGGNRMKGEYGYSIPSNTTGECWAISAHPSGVCKIASGTYAGWGLDELWSTHPELFGNQQGEWGGQFPLLVKIIDAKEDLSIQVHPDDVYAAEQEAGALGKMECWYILDCDPGTTIVIGHHAKDRQQVESMIRKKDWTGFVREVPVKKGDFFQINAGCVHAIKGGTLILETQQSSDITYRVYDYDRMTDGKLRELHIQQSIDVIEAPYREVKGERKITKTDGLTREHLVSCSHYTVEKWDVHGICQIEFYQPFVNVSILEGEGQMDGVPVKKGQHLMIPSGYSTMKVEGHFEMICSWPESRLKN